MHDNRFSAVWMLTVATAIYWHADAMTFAFTSLFLKKAVFFAKKTVRYAAYLLVQILNVLFTAFALQKLNTTQNSVRFAHKSTVIDLSYEAIRSRRMVGKITQIPKKITMNNSKFFAATFVFATGMFFVADAAIAQQHNSGNAKDDCANASGQQYTAAPNDPNAQANSQLTNCQEIKGGNASQNHSGNSQNELEQGQGQEQSQRQRINNTGNSTNNIGVGVEGASATAEGSNIDNNVEAGSTGDSSATGGNIQNSYDSEYRDNSIDVENNPNSAILYYNNICGVESKRGVAVNNTTLGGGVGDTRGFISLSKTHGQPTSEELERGMAPAIQAQETMANGLQMLINGTGNEDIVRGMLACNGKSAPAPIPSAPAANPPAVVTPEPETGWSCDRLPEEIRVQVKECSDNQSFNILYNRLLGKNNIVKSYFSMPVVLNS